VKQVEPTLKCPQGKNSIVKPLLGLEFCFVCIVNSNGVTYKEQTQLLKTRVLTTVQMKGKCRKVGIHIRIEEQ